MRFSYTSSGVSAVYYKRRIARRRATVFQLEIDQKYNQKEKAKSFQVFFC